MLCFQARRSVPRLAALFALAVLASCGGSSGSGPSTPAANDPTPAPAPAPAPSPSPMPPPVASAGIMIETEEEAVRFLTMATFGGRPEEIDALVGQEIEDWIAAEIAKPATLYLPRVVPLTSEDDRDTNNVFREEVWKAFIENDDQLRTRMTFALSQIVVANARIGGNIGDRRAAFYVDAIARNAFGNYRDLLDDVTYTPLMARFLTYMQNRKADPARGRMPDENYAREIMQLFSIGLIELNMDGTPRLDANGEEIETYDNSDVEGLARVFTGLNPKGGNFFNDADVDAEYAPLVMDDNQHSPLEKTFLGATIPAGTPGNESIDQALDIIFNHPNVPPFIARQLIQRFTAPNPAPEYVERVATAFATGTYVSEGGQSFGTGQRGSLAATIAAVLLDETNFDEPLQASECNGKVREPVINFVHYVRAFRTTEIDPNNEFQLSDTRSAADRLAQMPFRAPSVFNFYRPGFVPPGTEAGQQGLTVPEFQIVNDGSAVGYTNFMTRFVFDESPGQQNNTTFNPNYTDEILLADDAGALADHLDVLLTGGRMEAATRTDIVETLDAFPIRDGSEDDDRLKRVKLAVLITVNAPSYRIQR